MRSAGASPLVVPANAGTHMWTAPDLQESWQRADRIACDHMSGLLMAVHMTACQDGFRDAGSEHTRDVEHRRVPRSVARLGSIDHTICSVSSKLRPQREAMARAELVMPSPPASPAVAWCVAR